MMVINLELPDCWEKVNLGDVLSYIGNGLTNKQNKTNDGYSVTRIETISDDCINAEKVGYVNTLTNNKIEKYRLRYGDILVSHINSEPQLGRAVIYEGKPEFLLHGMNLLRMRVNTEILDPFFLNLIFKFYRNRGVFVALASRSVGQASINQSRMKSLMIALPSLSEQRAINHVLQTIQEAKFTRQREIALERERKAALMDFLFSHGTKDEPRKQTEIGEIPESWDVVQTEDVGKIVTGNTPKTSVPEYYGGPYMFISPGDISEPQYVTKTNKHVSTEGLKVLRPLPRDSVLVVCISSTIGKTAMTSAERSATNQQINAIIPNAKAFSHYVYYAVSYRSRFLFSLAGRAAVPIVKKSIFTKFLIPLPPLSEQRAIANIFRAIDEKTDALEREVELMDELFHAILEELMTGQRSAVPLIDTELVN